MASDQKTPPQADPDASGTAVPPAGDEAQQAARNAGVAAPAAADEAAPAEGNGAARKKVPIPLKVYGILMILWGAFEILVLLGVVLAIILAFVFEIDISQYTGGVALQKPVLALLICLAVCSALVAGFDLALGVMLVRDRRRHSAQIARTIMVLLVVQLLLNILNTGVGPELNSLGLSIIFMVVLQIYLDPSLVEERALDRKLRKLDARSREEERLAHLQRYGGKAPFKLTFFNLFWTFVICCFFGVVIETAYCLVVGAGYMDRAGLLYGPFSPIYGFGAVLMTIGLNGIRNKNPLLIFLLSAVIGGAFEFLVSYLLEYAFGITAWDYTGTFLSIDGRTNGFYMTAWGLLGLLWVKVLMPAIFDLVHKIPWNWRYAVTGVALALMVVDGGLTLVSYDRWFSRQVGIPAETAVEEFCDEHYDDAWMEHRFQTMTMNAENAAR